MLPGRRITTSEPVLTPLAAVVAYPMVNEARVAPAAAHAQRRSEFTVIAPQLSRNAIAGQDDPAILKELYDELESVEWRQCTGLDDKALDLLGWGSTSRYLMRWRPPGPSAS
ncbi:hypothetical protein [Streptomyces sp. NPDC057623]|uniref:hypothetical protein n=1 Tax=Streptomyces sp. NPDC057623 TaxID=3346187 RepID=UPI0036BF49FB